MASSWLVLLVTCAVLMPVDLRSLREQQAREFLELLRIFEVDENLKIPAEPPIDVGLDQETTKSNAGSRKAVVEENLKIPAEPPIDVGLDQETTKSNAGSKKVVEKKDYPDFTYLVGRSREMKEPSYDFSKFFKALEKIDERTAVPKPDRRFQTLMQRMQKTSDSETKLDLNFCYFCDQKCEEDITRSFASVDAYFQELTRTLQEELKSLRGYNISAHAYDILKPEEEVDASQYCPTSGSNENKLAAVNNEFWQKNDLWSKLADEGCDVGFYAVSSSDRLWSRRYVRGVKGIASMFQICRPGSYSTVQLDANPGNMAPLILHELAHLMGIYHDGSVDRTFTRYGNYFLRNPTFAAPYQNLVGNCTRSDQNCQLGNGQCTMDPVINSDHVAFSGCSVAYFDMFFILAKFWPYYYNDACLSA